MNRLGVSVCVCVSSYKMERRVWELCWKFVVVTTQLLGHGNITKARITATTYIIYVIYWIQRYL